MAAGDITLFQQFKLAQNNGVEPIDLDTDDIRVMIVKSTYTPDFVNHAFISSVDANEVAAGTSYSAGGVALAGKSMAIATGNAVLDATDMVIAQDATGFTDGFYVVFYKYNALNTAARLIALGELGANKSIVGGPLTFNWNVAGILAF